MIIDPTRLRELCAKGLNANQIATRMGATVSGVLQAIKRLNLDAAAEGKPRSPGSSSVRNA